MRLIDADKLMEWLNDHYDHEEFSVEYISKRINEQPTIEPEPQWIPCTERLPEDEYVIISKKPSPITGKKFSVTIGVRHTDPRSHKAEWRDIGFGKLRDDEVFAWQPRPEPYKEEGGQE